MITALSIIAALAVVCSLVATVFVAVTFREALRELSRAHSIDSARRDEMLSATLDRFQAIRWEDLAAMRSLDDTSDEGGFLSPEDQQAEADQFVEVDEQVRWGPLSRLRRANELSDAEQELLEEDFPDEFTPATEERS
jgi:hypothetical protein